MQPAEKAWQIVKFVQQTQQIVNPYILPEDKGYTLRIGDTVKFGRVRFKVILMHKGREEDTELVYKEMRFKGN